LPTSILLLCAFVLAITSNGVSIAIRPEIIEPATFQLIAQCLNQLRHRVPPLIRRESINLFPVCPQSYHIETCWHFALVCDSTSLCQVASRSHVLELVFMFCANVDGITSANNAMYPEPWVRVCRHEYSTSKKFLLRSTALGYFKPLNWHSVRSQQKSLRAARA
jgi:hypothetical protein